MRAFLNVSNRFLWVRQSALAIALITVAAFPAEAESFPSETEPLPAEAGLSAVETAPLPTAPLPTAPLPSETTAVIENTVDSAPFAEAIADDYTLGAGDLIELAIFNVPEYSGNERVLVDGSVSLEWVGNVDVEGLTLDEAANAIARAYSRYLKNPNITVSLITPRPLQVSVAGEVNRPGSYQVDFAGENGSDVEAERRWPTLTKVLQQAGGITQLADVRQVTVERVVGRNQVQTIPVDLWELLNSGNLSHDPPLRDGDTIRIPRVAQMHPGEAQQIAAASFSPDTVTVNVVGEVNSPGIVEVPPNTPLNQALLAAGGFDPSRADTSTVELVRLNPDGSVSQREIAVNFNQGINEDTNPILYPDDVIVVKPSGNAQISDSADGLLNTLGLFLPFLTLF
jgi:polysaccharide export outer membrane protein